jgi:hypothetical protein
MMMVAAGIATLGLMTAARAQAPDTPPRPEAPPLPPTIPNNAEPVSPTAPEQPGTVPSMVTPQMAPPPAPMVNPNAAPPQPPPATPYEMEANRGYPVWISKMGSAIMLGGGFEDFTQSVPKAQTSQGGSWNLRLAAGTRQFVGLEAAYVGGARNTNVLGSLANSALVNNGFEGNLRINVPVAMGLALIEPFGFAGIGWQHYHLSTTPITADITQTDNVMTVPYGGGIMAAYGNLMVDARVTWRQTYYNDMFRAEGARLNTWGVGGNIGVEF